VFAAHFSPKRAHFASGRLYSGLMVLATGERSRVTEHRSRIPVASLWQLAAGALLLIVAILAGLALKQRPWPNRLDTLGLQLARAVGPRWAVELVRLGSLRALFVGVVVLFALAAYQRDWIRAIACVIAPVGAVVVADLVAKPLVARTFADSTVLSYPSGTVTVVAALAGGAVLVAPGVLKGVVALLGALAVMGVSAAVVALHWHYVTDALGGICVGYGAVLVVDALAHLSMGRARSRGFGH
jgi:membrane-associated phospholipid phosphatase